MADDFETLAGRLYEALWANLNGNGAVENFSGKGEGGYTDAKVYATSRAIARWLLTGRQLLAQIDPDTVLELLPEREAQFDVIVPYGATLEQRRAALRAAMRRPGDGTFGDIRQALVDLLGSAFVDLRRLANPVTRPVAPGSGPGLFTLPTRPRQYFVLAEDVTSPGQMSGADPIFYTHLDGSLPTVEERLRGPRAVIEPGHLVLQERVTVGSTVVSNGTARFYATLTRPHHKGALITTQPYPFLYTHRVHWVVQLTPSAALDAETRRRVHRLMRREVTGISTWDIVGSSSGFTLGSSPLGSTPF